ncbi:MAG: hypothetical protein DCC54_01495 [Anaerolineae bacterium]|nr:MAG: hypothetical protein DCC54_01495 [Anaerolineae bacterium]
MKIRDENGEFESSDLPTGCCARGDSAMGISLQLERKFIIHPCSSAGLVIEVDGDVHDLQEEEDERREKAVSGLCHGLTDGNGLHPSSFIGNVHDLQKEEDERREKVLSEMGLRIVRFRNDEVVKNLSAVVGRIRSMLVYLATR